MKLLSFVSYQKRPVYWNRAGTEGGEMAVSSGQATIFTAEGTVLLDEEKSGFSKDMKDLISKVQGSSGNAKMEILKREKNVGSDGNYFNVDFSALDRKSVDRFLVYFREFAEKQLLRGARIETIQDGVPGEMFVGPDELSINLCRFYHLQDKKFLIEKELETLKQERQQILSSGGTIPSQEEPVQKKKNRSASPSP